MSGCFLSRLLAARSGVAAAEMALVAPLLTVLMFTTFETGNYFYSQHVVLTAVRDGARYASRRPFSDFTCGSPIKPQTVTNIINITMTGAISGGVQRLAGWTNTNTVTVVSACGTGALTGTDKGIYTGMTSVPIVTVTADVCYRTLFSQLGLSNTGICPTSPVHLVAQSQIPVMGI